MAVPPPLNDNVLGYVCDAADETIRLASGSVVHRVFSDGTLRQAGVQAALFGRSVPTARDSLPGFRLDWLLITDPDVIAASGTDRHPILCKGGPSDAVDGVRLELDDELARADD